MEHGQSQADTREPQSGSGLRLPTLRNGETQDFLSVRMKAITLATSLSDKPLTGFIFW